MMAQSVSFIVLVAALLINTLSYCSGENVYCVTPTATLCSSCPRNTHCATLSEYAQVAELYFTSNTTIVFLPGDHVLDTNITVANVARLTMHGESSSGNIATVVCNGSVGFSFTNMVDLNIYSLAFTSYNRSWSYGSHPASNSALLLRSTQNAKLVSCSFHDNLGTALVVKNTSLTLAENSEFIHNQCGCEPFSEVCELGCGITAFNCNLTFSGNTTFVENIASSGSSAGAIWTSASSLHFAGTNNFIGNLAKYDGGAIIAGNSVLLSFNGISNFCNNSAGQYGGAIRISHNVVLTFNGTNNFTNNSAHYGGAINTIDNVNLTFIGINNFISNNGGAIYTSHNTLNKFIGTSNFSKNSAVQYGGAIYAEYNVVFTFNGTNNFINNSGWYGGGVIYARGGGIADHVVVTFNGTNNFIKNSANSNGGAIHAEINALLSFAGTNNFIHNFANIGGAIDAQTNTLSFFGTSNFSHNSAGSTGGAINTDGNVVLTFNGISNFFCNSAIKQHGGAIFISHSVVTFNGSSNFSGNSANSIGGAIFALFRVSLSFTGTTIFSSNSAMQGGAISAHRNSTLTFNGSISFTNNGHDTQDSRGGAMYLASSSTLSILPHTTVSWEDNHANLGGAIYVSDVNPFIYCTQFANYMHIHTLTNKRCFLQLPGIDVQLVFKNNFADDAGSVLYGGAIDNCKHTGLSSLAFNNLAQDQADNTTSSISSDPFTYGHVKTTI